MYRGLEYERIGAFTQRLQTEFPQAQILTKNTPPDSSIFNEIGQYIQISNVKPIPDQPLFQQAMVPAPEKIARFYHVNDVTRFQHDRPVYKGQVDRDNEFKSLWIERTTLDIAQKLPGILRWFEITDRLIFEISVLHFDFLLILYFFVLLRTFLELTPVEFACETMENVGKELSDLIVQYRSDSGRNINPFSMRLQGIIDANVMGGISKYQEAFFNEEFAKSTEGKGQLANVQRLKDLILKQVQILDTALELHGTLAPEGVQPLHNRLLERYSQMKQSLSGMEKIKRQFSESIVNTPLPPLPIEKREMSLGHHSAVNMKYNKNCNIDQHPNYELEDIYTRPMESNGNHVHCNHNQILQRCISNREQVVDVESINENAPPIPIRPKSAGYSSGISESPEIPPKLTIKEGKPLESPHELTTSAPPLPPRAFTTDKRLSNPINCVSPGSVEYQQNDFHISSIATKRGLQKYSVVNISLDDQIEAEHCQFSQHQHYYQQNIDCYGYEQPPQIDFRDSGISTTSQELNNSIIYGELVRSDASAPKECLNINVFKDHSKNSNDNFDTNANEEIMSVDNATSPPPIPRKMTGSMGHGINLNQLDIQSMDAGNENRSVHIPSDQDENDLAIDDYCLPKNSAIKKIE